MAWVGSDTSDLTELEMKAWKKIQPSVVSLLQGQQVRGSAALISREGLFIAHATAVNSKAIEARKSDGSLIKLKWLATDEPTQFVLLQAEEWSDNALPLGITQSDAGSKGLLAITPTGPVRAERARDTFGIVEPSKRMVPMTEVLLENNLPTLGGSLLFNLNGELAGALNATLGMSASQNARRAQSDVTGVARGGAGGGGLGGPGAPLKADMKVQYGPGILTAAYTIGPKVLKRVVSGFLSEDRIVRHPAIGIFCRDALPQGALIDSVNPDSPAAKAGLVKNDVIYAIGSQAVRTQIDFARIMGDQEVGDAIKIWVRRGQLQQLITVTVGTQP